MKLRSTALIASTFLATLTGLSNCAHADPANFWTGARLQQFCNQGNLNGQSYTDWACSSYIIATTDTLTNVSAAFVASGQKPMLCLPPGGVPSTVAENITRVYMAQHPEVLSQNASHAVEYALFQNYPCNG